MSGSPRDESPEPSEFYIVDRDDAREPGSDSPSDPRDVRGIAPDPPEGTRPGGIPAADASSGGAAPRDHRSRAPRPVQQRRAALGVAGVLILALGIAIGMHLGDGVPTAGTTSLGTSTITATAGSTSAGSATADPKTADSATVPTQAEPTQRTRSRGSGPSGSGSSGADGLGTGAPTVTSGMGGPTAASLGAAVQPEVHTAKNICGNRSVVSVTSGVKPLHATTGLHLLAGADLGRFDVDTGTADGPLLTLPHGQYVSQVATGGHGSIVAVVATCGSTFDSRVLRIDGDGHASTVATAPSRTMLDHLVTGGHRIWAAFTPSAGSDPDSRTLLIAADGSNDTVKLPRGFYPKAGWHRLIIGRLSSAGLIQVYDLARHGIVDQIVAGGATNLLVGDGFFLWEPRCDVTCPVHRYDLHDGTDTVIGTIPGHRQELWRALSQDGTRLVRLVPRYADSAADVQHARGDADAATRGVQLAVTDLDSGETEALKGIDISLPVGSVTFSPDSTWLIVAVPTSSGERILLYNRKMDGPYAAAIDLPAVTGVAPLAVLSP